MAIIRDPDEVLRKPMKNKIVKYPFYYRTRDQYEAASMLAREINDALLPPGVSLFEANPASLNSPPWKMRPVRDNMPKSKPGKKKYIATIILQPFDRSRLGFNVEERLVELGLEMVSKAPNKPKYTDDDLTFGDITFRTVEHFKKVSSMLDKHYGHGEWHYRGQRKIIAKLRQIERFRGGGFMFGKPSKKEQELLNRGIKVTVAVVGKVTNLGPLLFKAQLMG